MKGKFYLQCVSGDKEVCNECEYVDRHYVNIKSLSKEGYEHVHAQNRKSHVHIKKKQYYFYLKRKL